MATAATPDSARFTRPRLIPGIELVSVCYRERSFPEHSHSEYVLGAVVAGAETLTVAGRAHRIGAGAVLRLHPDQAHANASIGADSLRYDVLYIREDVVRSFGDEHTPLRFGTPSSGDRTLFAAVRAAHAALGCNSTGLLDQESALGALVQAYAVDQPRIPDWTSSRFAHPGGVQDAKAYIEQHYASGFGLHQLAELSGLSVFHFKRSFKRLVGLSPLAYRNQRRVVEARARLLDGEPIAQVALAMGYADQSHLTRQFQRIVGASPRRHAQQ